MTNLIVQDLEGRISLPEELKSRIEVEKDGKHFVYVAHAKHFNFKDQSLRGYPSLVLYNKLPLIGKWVKRATCPVGTFISEELGYLGLATFITSEGRIEYGDSGYKKSLRETAAKLGIQISARDIENVFGLIDRKLLDLYHQFENFKKVEGEK